MKVLSHMCILFSVCNSSEYTHDCSSYKIKHIPKWNCHLKNRNREGYLRSADENSSIYGIEIQVISKIRKLLFPAVQIRGEDHRIAPAYVCMERERERENLFLLDMLTTGMHVIVQGTCILPYYQNKNAPLQPAKMVSISCINGESTSESRDRGRGFQTALSSIHYYIPPPHPNLEPSSFRSKLRLKHSIN